MPSFSAAQASNSAYSPSYTPTALFIGGTSGIGRGMAEAYAAQTKGKANIIIIGRNKQAADEIIAKFPPPPSSDIKHEFVSCDAGEMANVHKTSQELLGKLEKINLLVLSTGGLTSARKDTAEGNDVSIALRYYARAKFTLELLPLLEKAQSQGEDARMMTILAAAQGGTLNLNDMGVSNWSIGRASTACGMYNDVMIKVLSEKHPNIAFMHMFPGVVDTPSLHFHWAASIAATLAKPLIRSPATAAQYLLYPLLNPDFAKGGYWLTKTGEKLTLGKDYTPEVEEKVWKHTEEVINV